MNLPTICLPSVTVTRMPAVGAMGKVGGGVGRDKAEERVIKTCVSVCRRKDKHAGVDGTHGNLYTARAFRSLLVSWCHGFVEALAPVLIQMSDEVKRDATGEVWRVFP
jgi:hypothetical protein